MREAGDVTPKYDAQYDGDRTISDQYGHDLWIASEQHERHCLCFQSYQTLLRARQEPVTHLVDTATAMLTAADHFDGGSHEEKRSILLTVLV